MTNEPHKPVVDLTLVIGCLIAVGVVALVSGVAALGLSLIAAAALFFVSSKRHGSPAASSAHAPIEHDEPQAVSIEAPAPAMPTITDLKLKTQVDAAILGLRTHSFTGPTLTNLNKIIAYIPRLNDAQRGDLDLITTTIVTNTDRISASIAEGSSAEATARLVHNLSTITAQSGPVLAEMREHFENERADSSAFDVNYITSRFPSGELRIEP